MTRLLLALELVKAKALGLLGRKVRKRLAAKAHTGHGRKLRGAVLTEHVGVDGVLVQARALGDGVAQARGVKRGARAHDALGVAAGEAPDLRADDVAGIGDGDPDALEAGVSHAGDEGAGDLGGHEQLAVTVLGGTRNVAGSVHDDVAAGELLVLVTAVHDLAVVRVERQRIREVLGLARELLGVDVAQVQLVDKPLDEKRVRNVSAYVALAKDANLTDASHVVSFSLGWFGPTPPARARHE